MALELAGKTLEFAAPVDMVRLVELAGGFVESILAHAILQLDDVLARDHTAGPGREERSAFFNRLGGRGRHGGGQ